MKWSHCDVMGTGFTYSVLRVNPTSKHCKDAFTVIVNKQLSFFFFPMKFIQFHRLDEGLTLTNSRASSMF